MPTKTLTDAQTKAVAKSVVTLITEGTDRTKYEPLERSKIARIHEMTETVNVSLQRWEQQGLWTATKKFVDAGMYRNVPTLALMDAGGWIHSQAGGSDYTVELTHPNDASVGVLYGFRISVPGAPRVPEAIRAAELQAKTGDQDLIGKLAQVYINGGTPAQSAYEMATQTVKQNPVAAQMMVGNGGASGVMTEEDEMGQMVRYMMMNQMMGQQQQNYKPNGESRETAATMARLEARIERQDAEAKAAEERRRIEDRHRDEMAKMSEQMRELRESMKKDAAPKQDMAVGLASALAPIAAAMLQNSQSQRTAETAAAAEQFKTQIEFMRGLSEQSRVGGEARAKESEVMSNALRGMMEHQLALAKAKSEEPIQQIQAVQGMAAAMGGILNGYAQLAQSLMQDDTPAWLRPIQEGMRELPGMVIALLGGPQGTTSEPDSYDANEIAPSGVDEQIASQAIPATGADPAVEAGTKPPEQVEAAPAQTTLTPVEKTVPSDGPPELDPEEEKLVEGALAAIDDEELKTYFGRFAWWPILIKLQSNGDPRMLGRRIAEQVIKDHMAGELPEGADAILAEPGRFANLLKESFDLDDKYVTAMIGGFREWLTENKIEITPPGATEVPTEPAPPPLEIVADVPEDTDKQ